MAIPIEIVDTIISIITIGGFLGWEVKSNGKKFKLIEKSHRELKEEINIFRQDYARNEHILLNVKFAHEANNKINYMVRDANKILKDEKDLNVSALISRNGDMAKECIYWAVETNLDNITSHDFIVHYESCSTTLRDILFSLEPEFAEKIRLSLAFKGKRYIEDVREIIEDTIPNNRVIRFTTATQHNFERIISYLINERIGYNAINQQKNKEV